MKTQQQQIIAAMRTQPVIDVAYELQRRIDFLKNQLTASGRKGLVLGISGGVDSSVAGRLAQRAVEQLREAGMKNATFCALRLPYGVQADEADAQIALGFIQPDVTLTINIKDAVDALESISLEALISAGVAEQQLFDGAQDFAKGNVKARIRMVFQYRIANAAEVNGLVVGTDHSAEAVMGFYTKFGDGAADLCPLFGLTKGQVRQLAKALGAPEALYAKPATADLEELNPQKPDEEALGLSYEVIDAYLEGRALPEEQSALIESTFEKTAHKRAAPATLFG